MSGYSITINVKTSTIIGHTNVTFEEPGKDKITIGANTNAHPNDVFQIGLVTNFGHAADGIYREETQGNIQSNPILLDQKTYIDLKNYALSKVGTTYDYSVFTLACYSFVQDIYEKAGGDGGFGAAFSLEDAVEIRKTLLSLKIPGFPSQPVVPSLYQELLEKEARCFPAGTPISLANGDIIPKAASNIAAKIV